jgi:hypothetical protein
MTQTDDTTRMEKLLTATRRSDCMDYRINAFSLIPQYYTEGKFDSISAIIEFISPRCPDVSFESYQLLHQIQIGELDRDWCDSVLMKEMLSAAGYYGFCGMIPYGFMETAESDYDSFIRRLASEVQNSVDTTSVAHAIATYYSGKSHTLLPRLAAGSYRGTCLQARYDAMIDSLMEERLNFALNWSINAGVWIPTANLGLVGSKPEVGVQGGLRSRRFGGDLTILVRLLNAEQSYLVRHKDSLYETDNFFSIYLGLGPVLKVYSSQKISLEMFGGTGWDGIMALTADDIDEAEADYLNSLNVNVGFTVRWHYGTRDTRYFGIQTRYNVVDFRTGGGTDLSGNSISINLVWGTMGHGWVDDVLENLHHFR